VREGVSGDVLTAQRNLAPMHGATAIRNNPYRRAGLALSVEGKCGPVPPLARLTTNCFCCSGTQHQGASTAWENCQSDCNGHMGIFMTVSSLGGDVSGAPWRHAHGLFGDYPERRALRTSPCLCNVLITTPDLGVTRSAYWHLAYWEIGRPLLS